jgi:carboxymethylenebutenolidase
MAQRVSIPTQSGALEGVLALPAGDARSPAVVVVQEYWGITEQLQSVVDRWAAEGFLAIAPDLYHGKLAATAAEAGAMMDALDFGNAVGEIAAAAQYLRTHPRSTGQVAITGYCLGGALTFAAAVNVPGFAAAVPFYGLPGDLDWSKIDAPVQAHFAQHDTWATVAGAEQIKAAVTVPMELHVYDAQHAFCNDCRPEVYNPEAASLAWSRAVAFVRAHTTATPTTKPKQTRTTVKAATPGKTVARPKAKTAPEAKSARPATKAKPKTTRKATARLGAKTSAKRGAKTSAKRGAKTSAKLSAKRGTKTSPKARSKTKPAAKAKPQARKAGKR